MSSHVDLQIRHPQLCESNSYQEVWCLLAGDCPEIIWWPGGGVKSKRDGERSTETSSGHSSMRTNEVEKLAVSNSHISGWLFPPQVNSKLPPSLLQTKYPQGEEETCRANESEQQRSAGAQPFIQAPQRDSVIFFSTGKKLLRVPRFEQQDISTVHEQDCAGPSEPRQVLLAQEETREEAKPTCPPAAVQSLHKGNSKASHPARHPTLSCYSRSGLFDLCSFRIHWSEELGCELCSGDAAQTSSSVWGAALGWGGGHLHLRMRLGLYRVSPPSVSLWKPAGGHVALWGVICKYTAAWHVQGKKTVYHLKWFIFILNK